MTKESLIALGLSEELAAKVIEMHQTAINGNYVPKSTFEAERTKSKNLSEQVAQRDTQIAELGGFKGTAEELTKKVGELEKKNAEDKEQYEAELKKAQEDAALRVGVAEHVIDPDDVLPKLDRTKITFEDGKVKSGLTEQLESLKQSKPHYFKTKDNSNEGIPNGWLFGDTPPDSSDSGDGGDSKTDAQKFGELLAASKLSGTTAAEKAANAYFK